MKRFVAAFALALGMGAGLGMTAEAAEIQAAAAAAAAEAAMPVIGFVQDEKGIKWRNADGSWQADSWLEWDGRRYHFSPDGYIQVGLTKVDGKTYFLYPEGVCAVGWLQLGDGLYFFQADGTMAVNTTIGGYQFGKDGKLVLPEQTAVASPLKAQVDAIIASVTTAEMTPEQKLRACYKYMIDHCSYKRTYETPAGDWTGAFATEILTTGKGNCYRYAAGFAYLAKGLGFEARVATGSVRAARGGVTPHGWTEIKFGDTWYIFDSELQDAKNTDLYMKTYSSYPIKPLNREAVWELHF